MLKKKGGGRKRKGKKEGGKEGKEGREGGIKKLKHYR